MGLGSLGATVTAKDLTHNNMRPDSSFGRVVFRQYAVVLQARQELYAVLGDPVLNSFGLRLLLRQW